MITRQDYVRGYSRDVDSAALHRSYYAQLVDGRTIAWIRERIGLDRLVASTDPHFNDIPLREWDRIVTAGPSHWPMPMATTFKALGDYPTLAGLVCVAKEAARQAVEADEFVGGHFLVIPIGFES